MKSRSSPRPRRSDWNVWQWALTVPGRSALPVSMTSLGQTRCTCSSAAMRPPSTTTARPDCQPAAVRTRSGTSRWVMVAGAARPPHAAGGLTKERPGSVRSLPTHQPAALDDAAHVVHAVEVREVPPVRDLGEEQVALLPGSERPELRLEPHRVGAVERHAEEGLLGAHRRSEEHTSELQSLTNLVCRLLLEKKKTHATSPSRRCTPTTASSWRRPVRA